MSRSRALPPLVAALLLSALGTVSWRGTRVASAAPEETGNITFAAVPDPERVPAGGKGVLVITGTIRKGVHVYADKRFKVTPVEVEGVTYGPHETSKPTSWRDPAFPEDPPSDVFFDKVVVRVPFEVGADARLPLAVGATIKWSACDEEQCYAPEAKGPITAEVKAPEPKKPPEPPPEPAPGPSPQPAPGAPGETPRAGADSEAGAPPVPAVPPAPAPQPPPTPTARASFDVRATHTAVETKVTVRATEKEVVVLFEPAPGHHLYAIGHEGGEFPVSVRGQPAPGVEWGEVVAPLVDSTELHGPYELRLPYTDRGEGTAPLEVDVSWQACLDSGTCRAPEPPHRFTVERSAAGAAIVEAMAVREPTPPAASPPAAPVAAAAPPPAPSPATQPSPAPAPARAGAPPAPAPSPAVRGEAVPATGLLFPVIGERPKDTSFRDWGVLLTAFLAGMGLALTPCVLPIIPITVSIIGGGRADLSRGRLSFLLGCYVLGLTLTFGSMGVIAGLTGGSLAAVFQDPIAIWVIAAVFVVLSLGMFGIYELQPPAWMQRLQGGAKGGNPIGAFLFGAIAAVLASPCTGPFIAAALVYIVESGSVLTGFLVFVAIGLGMGAVLFAAGSLNLLMRPGPWMVWVRHVFGVLMVGGALYYLASSGRLVPPWLFAAGFLVAVAIAAGIARHLVRVEGETVPRAASQAAKVAVLVVVATGAVAILTRHAPSSAEIAWTTVTSRGQLVAEVDRARSEGKATVVDVWATWCTYCRKYDDVIEESPRLRDGMGRLHRLRMDLSSDDRPWEGGLREGLGIPGNTQPFMVFIDRDGRIRRDLDVKEWLGRDAEEGLLSSVTSVQQR